jgi:succinate-semialdehyde dehydrogenase/glutarate-semialdehyde dehydrogenase
MNAGQVCMAVERIYVVEDIYDEFVDKVVEYCSSITPGGDSDMGPIIWPPQLEVIESHLADALEKGATVALGGGRVKDADGLYFEPTVVTGVTHDMALMKEETFGPVVAVMKVSDEEEALRLANDSDYGLSSSVWTGDKRKGLALARQIESGSACVNDSEVVYGVTEAPFGGLKQSGVGSVNSESGLLGYSHLMPVVIDRFNNDREQMWYPFDAKGADGMRKAINFLWNTPIGRWMS